MATTTLLDPARVRSVLRTIAAGLEAVEHAARAIDERADDGFDAIQTIALGRLIAREAYRLQELVDTITPAPNTAAAIDDDDAGSAEASLETK